MESVCTRGLDEHRLGRVGELDSSVVEDLVDAQVHVLLDVHMEGVVGFQHDVHGFVQDGRVSLGGEVRAIKTDLVCALTLDRLLHDRWDVPEVVAGRLLCVSDTQDNPALVQLAIISNPARK